MTDEDRIVRIERRLDELRDFIGAEVTKVHNRVNDEVKPRGPAWWIRPVTLTVYVALASGVLALITAGVINWSFVERSIGLAEGVVR